MININAFAYIAKDDSGSFGCVVTSKQWQQKLDRRVLVLTLKFEIPQQPINI